MDNSHMRIWLIAFLKCTRGVEDLRKIFQGRCVWCHLEIPRGRGQKVYYPGEF